MLCFYVALKGAPLSRVMPIAFTSPLFGGEALSAKTIAGMALTIGGIALLTLG
jgi:transporter family protein